MDQGEMTDAIESQDYDELGPACITCRKRKRKCSRGEPCRMCFSSGIQCIYENPKKRGVKVGYMEVLSQRIDQLENMMIGQSLMLEPLIRSINKKGSTASPRLSEDDDDFQSRLRNTKEKLLHQRDDESLEGTPNKLRHMSENGYSDRMFEKPVLPPWHIIDQLLPLYFDQIHPWIPILHEPTFMLEATAQNYPKQVLVIQAIVAVTIKFLDISLQEQAYYYQKCRENVLLASMDRFSIESLRATIILAFDTIGCGKGPRSWSIVSSTTRIVEQLGLSVEEDDVDGNILLNRIGFLDKSRTPSEREGRRRIFWAIFLMDRFCSVTTGWNTSMMSSTIRRRLPMEGWNYATGNDKKARLFNISETDIDTTDEEDALGGYSYLVEATECLSKVVSFLLKQQVSETLVETTKQWLEKFQALDIMLVRWKRALPEKWRTLRVVPRGMDENLTVAHITHNTSVLLLHHNLAYPPPELKHWHSWKQSVRTCLGAAMEISTITGQFLSRVQRVCSPQFTFCVFIAARTLLAHQLHSTAPRNDLEEAFNSLVVALKTMSARWTANGPSVDNLAAKFAERLESAKNSKSEINARMVVFADDENNNGEGTYDYNNVSLASPPLADMLAGRGVTIQDVGNPLEPRPDITDFEYFTKMEDIDYIFSWGDERDRAMEGS